MFEFTLEWTGLRSPAARAIDARATTDRIGKHEALVLPLALLISFLFVLGIMTGARICMNAPTGAYFMRRSAAWACPCLPWLRIHAADR